MGLKIVIIGQDYHETKSVGALLNRLGHNYRIYYGAEAFIEALTQKNADVPDVILLDSALKGLSGKELFTMLQIGRWNIPTVIMADSGTIDDAIKLIHLGAEDYIVKPLNNHRLTIALEKITELRNLKAQVATLRRCLDDQISFHDIIGESKPMKEMFSLMQKGAQSDATVLIEGESGVGKELIAKALHSSSARCDGPFVAVNCGAIPDQLMESTLFGHVRGAFTGAEETKVGKVKTAHGGTLFLDEIGELKPALQVKILRLLQEKEIDPVGAAQSERVNVRIVGATNRNIVQMVRDGLFREDLYYRLNVFPILVPPLRKRGDDIGLLASHFLNAYNATHRKNKVLTPGAIRYLNCLSWPGNVRQLENAILRTALMVDTIRLEKTDFYWLSADMAENTAALLPEGDQDDGSIRPLADMEKIHIQRAVMLCQGNLAEAARHLGISRSTLYRKLEQYDLQGVVEALPAAKNG